jgi:hypothetical protein
MNTGRFPLPAPIEDDETVVALHSPRAAAPAEPLPEEVTAAVRFARSRAGRLAWRLVAAAVSLLLTAGTFLVQREWSRYNDAVEAQTRALEGVGKTLEGLQAKVGSLEGKLDGLEARLEKVEERYAGEVAKLAAQVAELGYRLDRAEAARGARTREWQGAMRRWDEEEESLEERLEGVIRKVLGRDPRGRR